MAKRIRPEPSAEPYYPGALLTVSRAAKYLGVGRTQVYRLIEWGEIEAVKSGRSVQVRKDSLDRFRGIGKLT